MNYKFNIGDEVRVGDTHYIIIDRRHGSYDVKTVGLDEFIYTDERESLFTLVKRIGITNWKEEMK